MGRDIDENWIEEAVERYRRIDELLAELDKAAKKVEVTVRSPDGLVEVVVTADGTIKDLRIEENLSGTGGKQLARSVRSTVTAATDAAAWARRRLHDDLFGEYQPLA